MKPAEWMIQQFGGVRATARAVGRNQAAVSRWKKRGTVPVDVQPIVLRLAKQHDLDITAEDLILGR